MDTGMRLNELRVKHKMTHQQLADESGVPIGTVKSILSGQTQNAGFSTVCSLLEAMHEPITEFYSGKVEKEPPKAAITPANVPAITKDELKAILREAIESVYKDRAIRTLTNEKNFWRFVAILFILVAFFWLQWDLRHPNDGIIRYGYWEQTYNAVKSWFAAMLRINI